MAAAPGPPSPALQVEICVESLESVQAAVDAGADRIELCSGLADGGVTPSTGLVKRAVASVGANHLEVHVLVRPRPGDFVFSAEEVEVMEDDIRELAACGVAGFVIGAVSPTAELDWSAIRRLLAVPEARGSQFSLHRCLDVCRDPLRSLQSIVAENERLRAAGHPVIGRVLSSGGSADVVGGARMLGSMARCGRAAVPPIRIAAGGGVTALVAPELVALGCDLHATVREWVEGPMEVRKQPPVYMAGAKVNSPETEYMRRCSTLRSVRALLAAARAAGARGSGGGGCGGAGNTG